ncbi:hypothetical protein ACFXTH_006428 [Malus domestica]
MGEGARFQLGTVGALTLSVVLSVSTVICNKALISSLGFTFDRALSIDHDNNAGSLHQQKIQRF